MSDHIVRSLAGGVLELRLARPEKKNALTGDMYRALSAALKEAASDDAVAAVLFTGEGDAFCAGNDLGDFVKPGGGEAAFAFIRALPHFPKPIVAAVQGLAVGIGTTMLLHCDLVYASPDAKFVTPFAKLGIVPEAASSLLLPAILGPAKAAAMLLLGEPIDAAAADAAGLVTALVPAADLAAHARAKATALAAMPPAALAETRRLMRGDVAVIAARMEEEAQAFDAALAGPEAKEAISAFFEKRAPVFARAGAR